MTIRDNAYSQTMRRHQLDSDAKVEEVWDVGASERWYDLSVSHDQEAQFSRRFAGHIENGRPSTSDPALRAG